MTQRNEDIDRVMDELERHGLRGVVSDRGKHLEVAWETPHGRRFVIAARTGSDWRGGLNLRSDCRKLLRADNIQPKQISELTFQRAMSLPKAMPPRGETLQKDVDTLTDLVFDLQAQLSALQERLDSAAVVSKMTKTGLVLGLLTCQFRHVAEVIRESKLTRAHVNTILQKAKNRGLVENGLRGMWRRKE